MTGGRRLAIQYVDIKEHGIITIGSRLKGKRDPIPSLLVASLHR
jgi:hypothetical protein